MKVPHSAAAMLLVCAAHAAAQTATPQHKHYEKSAGYGQAAAPSMPLAPRLQNLGVHTFRVTTRNHRAQLRQSVN